MHLSTYASNTQCPVAPMLIPESVRRLSILELNGRHAVDTA
jgi:hypothetical protein